MYELRAIVGVSPSQVCHPADAGDDGFLAGSEPSATVLVFVVQQCHQHGRVPGAEFLGREGGHRRRLAM